MLNLCDATRGGQKNEKSWKKYSWKTCETDRPLTKKGFDKKSSGFPPPKVRKIWKVLFYQIHGYAKFLDLTVSKNILLSLIFYKLRLSNFSWIEKSEKE
jgi:hypothetical protein